MESKKLVLIGVRVSPELRSELEALAKADRRPLSQFVHNLLRDAVDTAKGKKAAKSTRAG